MPLTDEQRARIEANRAKALEIRRQKQLEALQASTGNNVEILPQQGTSSHIDFDEYQYQPAATTSRAQAIPSVAPPAPRQQFTMPVKPTITSFMHPISSSSADKNPKQFPRPAQTGSALFANAVKQQTTELSLILSLVSPIRFKVVFKPFRMEIVQVLREIPSKGYDPVEKIWSFSLTEYELVKRSLLSIRGFKIEKLDEIPLSVRKIFIEKPYSPTYITPDKLEFPRIEKTITSVLFPFQKIGVMFGIEKNGRFLLADDMGLGKTLQAIAIANYYQNEWPLLVICPSSVKYMWKSQLQNYLPATKNTSYIIAKGSDPIPLSRNTSVVVIMSYDLMTQRKSELLAHSFYVIIFDECHMLKDSKTKRTKAAFDLSKKAHRVMLLSGTPALSRPAELFTQIRLINAKIFPNFLEYAMRYCDGKYLRFGLDSSGQSNPEELSIILSRIMIRRLKKDVLNDLPEKRREVIYLTGDPIEERMSKLKKAREAVLNYNNHKQKIKSRRETFMEYYVLTGQVKMELVADHIIDTFFYEGAVYKKIIIFGHHQIVLDYIQMTLEKKQIKSIRIDGTTSSKDRATLCDQFQNDPTTFAAVLSITAAGTGISLTAASCVVFAELYWNPSILIQAEDRAHRVGQKDSVLVQYILARKTADEDMWQLLGGKLKVLGEVNLSDETYRNAENTEKMCSSNTLITDFFKELANDDEEETFAKKSKKDDGFGDEEMITIDEDEP